jgi:hypothetical protein
MLSSITWKPKPTTTQPTATPSVVAPDAVLAASCPPRLTLFPAPGPWPPAPGPRLPAPDSRPPTPGSRPPAPGPRPRALRVTHLAKKTLPMRHKISDHHRNQLKNRGLQRHELQLHTPEQMRHPDGVLRRPDRVGPRCLQKLLTPTHPNRRDPYHPGDASCKKSPPDASPNFEPLPQPIEKQRLTTP